LLNNFLLLRDRAALLLYVVRWVEALSSLDLFYKTASPKRFEIRLPQRWRFWAE